MNAQPLTEQFWNDSIRAYEKDLSEYTLSDERLHLRCIETIDPLACSVLLDLVQSARIRLAADAQVMGLDRYLGAHLTIRPGAVLSHIEFGVFKDHWFVNTLLPFIDSIPNVTEQFWDEISEMGRTAPTTFTENESIPVKTPQQKRLMRSGRSLQYRIVRNFILKRSNGDSDHGDIGFLSSELPIDMPYAKALPVLRKLFRHYHRALTQLYRPEYQKERLWRARISREVVEAGDCRGDASSH